MAAAVILILFLFFKFNGRTRQESETALLCQISTKPLQLRPMVILLFFKMAAAAVLNF